MHVDNELVEFMPMGEQEYEEIIEEYEEKILVQEGAPEPFAADCWHTACPRQALVHNLYFWMVIEYIYDAHLRYRHFIETTCIDISTYESY